MSFDVNVTINLNINGVKKDIGGSVVEPEKLEQIENEKPYNPKMDEMDLYENGVPERGEPETKPFLGIEPSYEAKPYTVLEPSQDVEQEEEPELEDPTPKEKSQLLTDRLMADPMLRMNRQIT